MNTISEVNFIYEDGKILYGKLGYVISHYFVSTCNNNSYKNQLVDISNKNVFNFSKNEGKMFIRSIEIKKISATDRESFISFMIFNDIKLSLVDEKNKLCKIYQMYRSNGWVSFYNIDNTCHKFLMAITDDENNIPNEKNIRVLEFKKGENVCIPPGTWFNGPIIISNQQTFLESRIIEDGTYASDTFNDNIMISMKTGYLLNKIFEINLNTYLNSDYIEQMVRIEENKLTMPKDQIEYTNTPADKDYYVDDPYIKKKDIEKLYNNVSMMKEYNRYTKKIKINKKTNQV